MVVTSGGQFQLFGHFPILRSSRRMCDASLDYTAVPCALISCIPSSPCDNGFGGLSGGLSGGMGGGYGGYGGGYGTILLSDLFKIKRIISGSGYGSGYGAGYGGGHHGGYQVMVSLSFGYSADEDL